MELRLNASVTAVCSLIATLALAGFSGCGFNPTSPFEGFGGDTTTGTQLTGRFASGSASASALQALSADAFDGVTVEVKEEPTIKTSVSSDGSFTLRGLPEGTFTLVFRDANGNVLGELEFDGVLANSEITIVVKMADSGGVALVDEKRTGIGHGDVELEGLVSQVTATGDTGEGTLVVNGYTVLVKPGVTAIREGNHSRDVNDLRSGDRVHVKGVWQDTDVLAYEVKIQNDEDVDVPDDSTGGDQCANLNGAKVGQGIELEGTVDSLAGGGFMLRVNGNRATGPVQVSFGGTPNCVGQAKKSGTCQVGAGDQVHVRGTLTSCTLVTASAVTIQKKGN